MRETRQTYSLRFSHKSWKLITERARALFGLNKQGKVQRARYIERLAINEAILAQGGFKPDKELFAGKQETK